MGGKYVNFFLVLAFKKSVLKILKVLTPFFNFPLISSFIFPPHIPFTICLSSPIPNPSPFLISGHISYSPHSLILPQHSRSYPATPAIATPGRREKGKTSREGREVKEEREKGKEERRGRERKGGDAEVREWGRRGKGGSS